MEPAFEERFVLVKSLVVATDSLLDGGEDLELDTAHLLVRSICKKLLLVHS